MYQPNNPYGQYQGNNPYNQPRRRGGCLAWLAFLLLLAGGLALAYPHIQNNPAIGSLSAFFSSSAFIVLGVVGVVLLIVVGTLATRLRGTPLGHGLTGLTTLMVWVGIVVFILWRSLLNPQVGMTRTGFTTTYVSIFDANEVTFQNPSDGVTQVLCVGTDQQCDTYLPGLKDYPSQFVQGLVIQPGQSVSIAFDHAGNYYITSKNTPHMNLKIVVTGGNRRGGD